MKKLKYLTLVVASALTLASCSKDYIDEVGPANGDVSDGVIFTSKIGVENAMTGIYGLMQSYIPSSGRQNMYGMKTIQFNFDMRGNDFVADPANWWLYENDWSDNAYGRIATSARNEQIWRLYYKCIHNANAIVEKTGAIPEGDAVKNQLIGEARALRAYCYFQLARIYQFTYAKDINAPGIPVSTALPSADNTGGIRNTMKDVYTQITSDLEFAATNLTANRTNKYRINKNVAQMMLAEVYQEMAMADATLWAKAVSNAQAARTGFTLMSGTDYAAGFNNAANAEWMWALQFNASQSLSYASFFGYIDPTAANTRYKCIYINDAFVNLFTNTDVRKLFPAAPGQSATTPWKKWQTRKFVDNASFSGDQVLMRAAESYLIEAEGLAQQNQLEPAKDALFVLQKQRDASAVRSTAATKDALINEILVERRKELYGEIGVEYFDLKRYQRPLARTGNHWSSTINLAATSNKWRWQIPQVEMDANKLLTTADQNPL